MSATSRLALVCAAAAVPLMALAHPGYLGTLNHLGWQTITIAVAAALVDSFNPTSLGVLLLMYRARQRINTSLWLTLQIGFLYIVGHLVVYVLAGFGLNRVLLSGPPLVFEVLQITLAFALFVVGVHELDTALHTKKWFPWTDTLMEKLATVIRPATQSMYPFLLGVGFGLLELFLTGAIYLSFIRGITYDPTVHAGVLLTFMAIYLFVFVLPLILTVYLVGMSATLARLTERFRLLLPVTRAAVGLIFMGVAVWLTIVSVNLLVTSLGL